MCIIVDMFHKPQRAPPSTPEVGEGSIDAVSETGGDWRRAVLRRWSSSGVTECENQEVRKRRKQRGGVIGDV